MGKRIKGRKDGVVYSTDPEFGNDFFGGIKLGNSEEEQNPEVDKDVSIRIWLEKKQRGGRPTAVIKGLEDFDEDWMKATAKDLKSLCGVGGSAKAGQIIIQGDQRQKIKQWFEQQGFKDVKLAGS